MNARFKGTSTMRRRGLLLAAAMPLAARAGAAVDAQAPAAEHAGTGRSYDGPVFDVQAHAIKPSLLAGASAGIGRIAYITEDTRRIIVDDVLAAADDLDGAPRRAALGEDNLQVVTVNMGFPHAAPQVLLRIAQETNEWMAARTGKLARLIGTATIAPAPALAKAGVAPDGEPWADKGLALLRQAIEEHRLRGVMMSSNYDNVLLGDPVFEPYFALAARLQVPVIIHPAVTSVDAVFVPRRNVPTDAGFLNDQRSTLLDLVKAGILEKYPRLTIIATHLGGGILSGIGRFEQLAERFPSENWYVDQQGQRKPLPHGVRHYLSRIHYDCNNAAREDILHAVSVVGEDRLLTGTDFPWATDRFTRAVLGSLGDRLGRKIAYSNAARLFS